MNSKIKWALIIIAVIIIIYVGYTYWKKKSAEKTANPGNPAVVAAPNAAPTVVTSA